MVLPGLRRRARPGLHDPRQPRPEPPRLLQLLPARGRLPAFVTDGGWPANLKDDASRWSSDWNADRWVSVDLGAASTIDTVDLYWEAAYAVDYQLQVSDDNRTWRTVYQPSASEVAARRADVKSPGDAVGRHDTVRLPSPVTGRYVRMLGKERRSFYNPAPATAQFGYSLYEFQVWGSGGSAAAAYPALPGEQQGTYQTTFFDDFTTGSLDRSKWRVVRTGTEMGPVNGESQAYVDSPDTIRTENGSLILRAKYCKAAPRRAAAPTTSPPAASTPTPSSTSPTAG